MSTKELGVVEENGARKDATEGLVVARARCHVARTVMDPTSATSENALRAKFAEKAFHALR